MSESIRKSDPLSLRMAKIMVGGAVFAASCYAIELGLARATSIWLAPAVVSGLICVVIGEILMWHNAAMAWHERRAGTLAICTALACCCSAGTLYTNYSTSAINQEQKSAVQLTAYNTYSDTESTAKELKGRLDALDAKLRLAPVETAEAYDSKIENFKAHRYWNLTDGCKKTIGPKTRAFCSDYASAVANKSNATESLTLTEERKQVAAKLERVRGERKTATAVVSDESPAIVLLANWTGDKAEARQLDSMTFPLLVQAIMLFGGILLANETARDMDKKPWINWRKLGFTIHWIVAALSFKPLPSWSEYEVHHHNTTIIDPHGAEALRKQAQYMRDVSSHAERSRQLLNSVGAKA